MRLRIRNWREYQHYKDRAPPWIKLHFSILSSKDWVCASNSERLLAIACMLIASQDKVNDGSFDADPNYFQRVAYLHEVPDFNPLIKSGFLEVMLADASKLYQMQADARPEESRGEERQSRAEDIPLSDSANPDDVQLKNGKQKFKDSAIKVLNLLNARTGRNYRPTRANLEMIAERMKEGASERDCRVVIAVKAKQWIGTEMDQYLRPATLFNRTKFNQYLGEIPPEANHD